MALKSASQINADLTSWLANELNTKVTNTSPILYPDVLNAVLTVLESSIKDITDSHYNKVDGISTSNVAGLVTALAGKETADATILKQANIVNNVTSTSIIQPLSANQGKVLKDLIDGIHAQNSDTILDEGNANEVTAAALRTHLDDATIHFTQSQIDHTAILNKGTNTHAQIDTHIADSTLHYAQSAIDHTNILNVGSNTHAQIDTHIAATNNPHSTTLNQALTASGLAVTKGNIYVANGTSPVALTVGSNGQVLKANSATASGLEWSSDLGESNTITGLGGQTDLVIGKSGSALQIRTLQSINNALTINNNANVTEFTIVPSNISHTALADIGTNTHAQIDAHIANTSNPHGTDINDLTVATTKGDILAYTGAAHERLGVGTNGQVLVADSAASGGLTWSSNLTTAISHTTDTANPHDTTLDQTITEQGLVLTKGTVYVPNGSNVIALSVGTNGQVLTANSATTSGLEWSTPTGEANTASNLTASGVGFYDSKSGSDLRFKRLDSASTALTVTLNGNKVDLSFVPSNVSHQALSGAGSNTHTQIDTHISSTSNPHNVTKTQVGLANVPNVDATDVDNHISGTTNKVFTAVEQTKLSGIATLATANPVQTALTGATTSVTYTVTGTPDYAVATVTNSSPFGFTSLDEAEAIVNTIVNLQTRVNELETKLQAANIIA